MNASRDTLVQARRDFLRKTGLGAAALLLGHSHGYSAECTATEDNIEGPFYKAGAPERSVLVERGMSGTRLIVTGRVTSIHCEPLRDALLDVWQTDDAGQYDNQGLGMRGRLYTDKSGVYRLETIVPKHYRVGGEQQYRPAHIHLKVSAKGYPVLTTQLYFPGDPYNAVDRAFRPSLVINPKDARGGKTAQFNFVLKPA